MFFPLYVSLDVAVIRLMTNISVHKLYKFSPRIAWFLSEYWECVDDGLSHEHRETQDYNMCKNVAFPLYDVANVPIGLSSFDYKRCTCQGSN